MILDNAFDNFASQMIKKFNDINWSPIIPKLEQVVATSIDRNFSEGGRFGTDNAFGGGSQKWTVSKRAIKQSGQTLVDSGLLAGSVQIRIGQRGNGLSIEISSNRPYAAIHNFGGTIQRAARSKLYTQNRYKTATSKHTKGQYKKGTSWGQGDSVGEHTITIPARPFLVLQNEDILKMKEIISNYIFRVVFN